MAKGFNKVILIGNLTADPECRTFSNGGKVAKVRLAVNNSKKNTQTGQWEDDPMFIDVDVFNRGDFGTLANVVEQYCKKGSQICIEGHLVLETWDDKTSGAQRSKHKIVAESIQLLGARPAGGDGGAPRSNAPSSRPAASNEGGGYSSRPSEDMGGEQSAPPPSGNEGEEIPF